LSLTADKLSEFVQSIGEPKFRSTQIFDWLHNKRVKSFDEMTNLSKALRVKLDEAAFIPSISVMKRQKSSDGTVKFLYAFADGNCIETVAMFYKHGMSVCVSSQVGCRMGCRFCASTRNGLVRNLSASEILLEVYETERQIGERADSLVLMGIGEPLDNYCNVCDFYDIITDSRGYALSRRSVSLSTCGLCDRIDELAELKLPLTLSISLHAATDEKRSEIMPINKRYSIERLMDSCKKYFAETGRRISFEYAVISGVNDSQQDADEIYGLLKGMTAHVNLIPVNPAANRNFTATREQAQSFCDKLTAKGINATIRRTLGNDISAACGQLRRDTVSEKQ